MGANHAWPTLCSTHTMANSVGCVGDGWRRCALAQKASDATACGIATLVTHTCPELTNVSGDNQCQRWTATPAGNAIHGRATPNTAWSHQHAALLEMAGQPWHAQIACRYHAKMVRGRNHQREKHCGRRWRLQNSTTEPTPASVRAMHHMQALVRYAKHCATLANKAVNGLTMHATEAVRMLRY